MSDTRCRYEQRTLSSRSARPTDIYNEPVNAFVADFIGEINIIDGVMLE